MNKIYGCLPEGTDVKNKPFILLWAEPHAVEVLKGANCAFSEATNGISQQVPPESAETTNGPQNEGADTTWSAA
jgi:hypothetical protein